MKKRIFKWVLILFIAVIFGLLVNDRKMPFLTKNEEVVSIKICIDEFQRDEHITIAKKETIDSILATIKDFKPKWHKANAIDSIMDVSIYFSLSDGNIKQICLTKSCNYQRIGRLIDGYYYLPISFCDQIYEIINQ